MLKLNKEYQLKNTEKIRAKIGTTNRNETKVIYIHGRAWVSPKYEDNYAKIVDEISKSFKHRVRTMIMEDYLFDKKHILDFNLSTATMAVGKKSFLSFDIFLKQNEEYSLKEIKTMIEDDVTSVVYNLEEQFSNNGFILFSKKNDADK